MAKRNEGYTLFKRTASDGKTKRFFVQFNDRSGKRMTAKSVEKLRQELGDTERYTITRRAEADAICRRALEAGIADGRRDRQAANTPFADYITGFWDFDSSEYIRRRNTKAEYEGKTQAIHRNYAMNRAGDVRNHILPRLQKNLKCKDVSFDLIEEMQESIIAEKSVSIWLNVRRTLSPAIQELLRKRVLIADPFVGIETYSASSKSNVGSLSQGEVNRLLWQMHHDCTTGRDVLVKKVYPSSSAKEPEYRTERFLLDKRVWLASCVLLQCGLRAGEVLAITPDSIVFPNTEDSENMAVLVVSKAFGIKDGIKSTKSGQDRAVALPLWLARELVALYETNPWKEQRNKFVFYSTEVCDKPCAESFLRLNFYRELEEIGITEEMRKERHLVLHSCRHTATQKVVTRAGSEAALNVIGHRSEAVQQRYDNHVDMERVLSIGRKTGAIIPSLEQMLAEAI